MERLSQNNWTHYLYIINFEDGCFYTGVSKRKGDNPLTDGYFGSPTDKKSWKFKEHEKEVVAYLWCESHEEAYQIEGKWQSLSYDLTDPFCLNKHFSTSGWTFEGKTHKEESKRQNGKSHRKKFEEEPDYREWKINHGREMGKGGHKRNTRPGTESMSGPNKRQYMRRHWRKEVWDDLEKTYRNRTGFRWGKIDLSKRHGVSLKTLDNMLLLIIEGVDWDTATNWGENL